MSRLMLTQQRFAHLRKPAFKDDLIRDRLVCGIRDNGQRKKLLHEPKLTLEKSLDSS